MANLKDLALASGVSIRTVNRVLKNDGYVGGETRQAVQAAVDRLGYRPNLAARALKTAKSHLVSVLSFTTDELRMAQMAALEQRLREADILVSATFHFDFQQTAKAARIVDEMISQNPAGLVLLGHDPFVGSQILPALVSRIAASGLPYVLVDPRGADGDAVMIDRSRGVYDAVHYLAEKGRRAIAFLGPLDDRTRLDGYEQALRELNRPPLPLDFPGTDRDGLFEAGRRFAARESRPDAVVIHSDYIALAFLGGLQASGLRVPHDVALIGFDDRTAAGLGWPSLTTVAQPSREIGQAAAEILLRKIDRQAPPPEGWSRSFPTRLVLRETA